MDPHQKGKSSVARGESEGGLGERNETEDGLPKTHTPFTPLPSHKQAPSRHQPPSPGARLFSLPSTLAAAAEDVALAHVNRARVRVLTEVIIGSALAGCGEEGGGGGGAVVNRNQ